MLEKEIINFKMSIRKKEPKHIVKQKFFEYTRGYDELAGEKTVRDKLEHKDLFNMYCRYMASSRGDKK
jgi:hypothetical protein